MASSYQPEVVTFEYLRVAKTLFQAEGTVATWLNFDPSLVERTFSSLGTQAGNKSLQVEKLMVCKSIVEKIDDKNKVSSRVLAFLLPLLENKREPFTRQVALDIAMTLWKSPSHRYELSNLGLSKDYMDRVQGEMVRGEYQDKFDVFVFLPILATAHLPSNQGDVILEKSRQVLRGYARMRSNLQQKLKRLNMVTSLDHYLDPRFAGLMPNCSFEKNTVFYLADEGISDSKDDGRAI